MSSGSLPDPRQPLVANPCRTLCDWRATRALAADGERLFACTGCGSQWRAGAGWTPANADGRVPPEVRAVIEEVTSARNGGGAGSGGTCTRSGS